MGRRGRVKTRVCGVEGNLVIYIGYYVVKFGSHYGRTMGELRMTY